VKFDFSFSFILFSDRPPYPRTGSTCLCFTISAVSGFFTNNSIPNRNYSQLGKYAILENDILLCFSKCIYLSNRINSVFYITFY